MCDEKRMAVVFHADGKVRVVCGRVTSEEDRDLGPVLRVELEQDGHHVAGQTTFIFQEESLRGRLAVDVQYGCDFCVDLGRMTSQHEARPKGGQQKVAGMMMTSV